MLCKDGDGYFLCKGEVVDVRFTMRDDRFAGYGHAEFATPDATQEVSFISVFCTQTEWAIITGSSSEWVGLVAEMVVDVVAEMVVDVVAEVVDLAGQAWQHSVQASFSMT
ncbi:hypothetical protein L1987_07901 [Smallanthus sonchifolius]|uniref:Uncharacterized protein n=1 Tax=Smallanthus sonchifolius TaxID=185202 RepID=A0ACB9JLD4_9ASTR|nr:hypothetical protein L1987_07901 [Smallanthus sonchifolius]